MAVKFTGTEQTNTEHQTLELFHNASNEISIIGNSRGFDLTFIISLDKETAIKFSKELRKQISQIES